MTDERAQRPTPISLIGLPGPGRKSGPAEARTIERAKNAQGALRRLMRYLHPHRGAQILVCIVAALGTGLAITAPYLMGRAIDQLTTANWTVLAELVLLMLVAYGLSAVAQLIQGILVVRISQKAMRVLRSDLFNHLQTLSLKFFDARSQGELMSRLTNDMDAINQVLTNHAAQLFTGILTLVGILIIMFVLSPWLAIGSMIAFPLMVGLVGVVGRKTHHVFRSYQVRIGALNAFLEETYSGQRAVLAFGQEVNVLTRFEKVNEAVRSTGVYLSKRLGRDVKMVPLKFVMR
jgi:ATP-binding cassette, subfamily B, multidrug efflux pump